VPQRDRHHLVGRGHFEIERPRQLGLETRDIAVGNVTAILAQVRGNAVRPTLDRNVRRSQGIGVTPAAGIPYRGDMVDIDAKPQHLEFIGLADRRHEWVGS